LRLAKQVVRGAVAHPLTPARGGHHPWRGYGGKQFPPSTRCVANFLYNILLNNDRASGDITPRTTCNAGCLPSFYSQKRGRKGSFPLFHKLSTYAQIVEIVDKWRKARRQAENIVESYPQIQQKVQNFVDKCFFVLIFLQVVYNIYYILLVIFDAKGGKFLRRVARVSETRLRSKRKPRTLAGKKPLGTGKSRGASEFFT